MDCLRSTRAPGTWHQRNRTPLDPLTHRQGVLARPVPNVDTICRYISPVTLEHIQPAAGVGHLIPADVVLRQLIEPQQLEELVSKHPALAEQPLGIWLEFLAAYGVSHAAVRKLILQCPELFIKTNIYAAGRAILFFKSLGWKDHDILDRIVPLYPQLLARDVATDFLPILQYLYQMGCSSKDVRLLAWEFPRIFSKDYRRHVRKFQYLGIYGLSREHL